ncbi:MAG: biopolymer transporter ExbD [Prevotella sp.]|nr:biopolymer transporter ExbD [Prevotella sp.]
MKIRRRNNSLPSLQMTAMPDLIFTILFFFMIVTHIRQSTPQIPYEEPAGANLQKMKKNAAVIDIFVGRNAATGDYELQVGNTRCTLGELPAALQKESKEATAYGDEQLCASLQADRHTPMKIINAVKTALRDAQILKINYSGTDAADNADER